MWKEKQLISIGFFHKVKALKRDETKSEQQTLISFVKALVTLKYFNVYTIDNSLFLKAKLFG